MMASPVPAKSQPLHNFDLPRTLKWNKDSNSNTTNHRRRSIKSPSRRPNNPSPLRDSTDFSLTRSKNPGFVKSERVGLKSEKKKSSKILIKIGGSKNSFNDNKQEEETVKEEPFEELNHGEEVKNDEFVDEEAKTWNLRPRKPIRKSLNVNGSGIAVKNSSNGSGSGSGVVERSGKAQSPVKNTSKSGENEGENEKRRHSVYISLTKEEIEEDIYAFTGQKPSRRPKKRTKIVQKQVDFVFPGLWLLSITPDSYKVSENSMKG